jgi:5,6-dimethylbenzimidazole synthase
VTVERPPIGLYEAIGRRRDVRAEFTGEPVDDDVRHRFHDHVVEERAIFAETLSGDQAGRFAGIKIEGVLDAPLSVVVTYDPARGAPAVLGRHAIADAGLYSVCLAIENLWLAATAEGLGVGWVSFYREEFLRALVGLPATVRPVAWLCLGPVSQLQRVPDLERHGWRSRMPLSAVLHRDRW